MDPELLKEAVENFPYAYAYLRIIQEKDAKYPDFVFVDVNSAFEKLMGITREQLLNREVSGFFVRDWASGFSWPELLAGPATSGTMNTATRFIKTLNMDLKITVYSARPGTVIVLLQTLTPRRFAVRLIEQQESELSLLAKNFEAVFNTTHDAMFLVEYCGGEFRFLRSNAAHQRISGIPQKEIFGKTPSELMGEERGAVILSNFQRCADRRDSISYLQALPFGSGVTWLTTLTPLFENGTVRYIMGSSKDITAQIALKQQKELLLERLESMFNEHTACMLLIAPESGKILDANPAACSFYGYSKEELCRMFISDINTVSWQETEQMRLFALERKQSHFLMNHRLKSGEMRLVDVYSCPITNGSEKQLFSIIVDSTDRERYRESLFREKERLRTTLLSIGDAVLTTDTEGRITQINQAAQNISGWSAEEVQNRFFSEMFRLRNEKTGQEVENPIQKVLKTGTIIGLANHTYLINKYGKSVPIADSAAPIRDNNGTIFGVVMVFRDVTLEKEQENRILFLSYHDALTGLYNRRYLESEMSRIVSTEKLPIAAVMGDVNGLKITNDVFGHKSGDSLLQSVARVLRRNCRSSDIIVRWGGDEFVMILPHTTEEQAQRRLEKIRLDCEKHSENGRILSVSTGCAVLNSRAESLEHKLQEAEEAMYHQKLLEGKSCRNTIITALLATLSAKSMETEEHAQRLQMICQGIGKELHLSENDMNDLSLLAILHDIGKVGVPKHILEKEGPLTPGEWKEMQKHSEIGYRIAQTTPELSKVSEYILAHHERWDGAGYPSGLTEEQIPLVCRILAVADAYDAMTNDRVYRKALPPETAIRELVTNAGTQFDPRIVELLLTISVKGFSPV